MATPSEQLAERIVQRLVEEHLLRDIDAEKAAQSLAAGSMKSEDWRLFAELGESEESEE